MSEFLKNNWYWVIIGIIVLSLVVTFIIMANDKKKQQKETRKETSNINNTKKQPILDYLHEEYNPKDSNFSVSSIELKNPKNQIDKTKTSVKTFFVCAIIVIVLFIIYIPSCFKKTPEWVSHINTNKMQNLAQARVKAECNYPSTVKFSMFCDTQYQEEDYDEKYYVMLYSGTFEAKNAFGTTFEYRFLVRINFDKETYNYTILVPIIYQ